ncbi:MAG: hypothetical protein DHS20C14_14100 [Phycisphaeraceae bacterium]|nr:MAG: hypothetical protein DHS20C14_14100 [Phycisphaeraceae bacterium]
MSDASQTRPGPASDPVTPPLAPAPIRWGVLVVSAAVGLSTLAGAGYAMLGFPRPVYGTFGFEVVATVAAVIGVLLGLGKFRTGFGLACLCVAGTFLTDAVFGLYLDANANINDAAGTRALNKLILARVAAAGIIAGLGGLAVLQRSGRSWGYLLKGLLIASPAIAAVGAAWLTTTRLSAGAWVSTKWSDAMGAELGTTGSMARSVAMVAGSLVLMVMFSVGAHLCIRAFEITRPDDQEG